MALRTPKLDLLKTFQRAAYHRNFTRAANELCITQAAVSRQIGILEEQLGIKLFVRSNRGIELTENARPLYDTVSQSLLAIEKGVNRVHQLSEQGEMRLSLAIDSSFADTWLLKRFGEFREQFPEVQIELQMLNAISPMVSADLQIIYGADEKEVQLPGCSCEFLYQSMDFVVCSPAVITERAPLQQLSDLKHHRLLHEFSTELWPNWLHTMGVDDVDSSQGSIVHDSLMCLEMAANGEAVILSDDLVAAEYLADGRLIKPLPNVRPNDSKIFLLQKNDQAHNPAAVAFRQWLHEELDKHQQQFGVLRECEKYSRL